MTRPDDRIKVPTTNEPGQPLDLYCAWLANAASWFLPVAGVGFGNTMFGWKAFRVAFSPVWPYGDSAPGWPWSILFVSSALTNLLMIAALFVFLRRRRWLVLVIGYLSVVAIAINGFWRVQVGSLGEFGIGYYLWLASFVILAVAMFRMSGEPGIRRS